MNVRNLFLIVSIMFVGQIHCIKEAVNEKYVRSELHRLLEQTNPASLSLSDVRKVHSLIHDLEKIDKKSADHVKFQYIEIQYGCSDHLSEFRMREIALEIKDAFKNPQPKDHKWKHKVENLLNLCHQFGEEDSSSDPIYREPFLLYKQYKTRYEKLIGHTYKPKPVRETLSEYAHAWYEQHGG
jgi:hypothetical protein